MTQNSSNIIHILNNLMTMVTLYPRDWASEYQWITPIGLVSEYQRITLIGLGIWIPMNNPHWFGYQNTNKQLPLVWVSKYQWIIPIGWYQNTNEWPPLVWVSESTHSQIVHNHICEIIVSNKNISYSNTYIYNQIFNIQIYLWYFYILTLNQYS